MPEILQASKGFTIFSFDKKKYIVSHTYNGDDAFNEFYELFSNKSLITIRSTSIAESIAIFCSSFVKSKCKSKQELLDELIKKQRR